MPLTLYVHPLASFCHKVLIALYENATPFTPVIVDFADPSSAAAHLDRWPVGKIPVLHDAASDRTVPETSIIIEYLQRHHPGPVALLPADATRALDARHWDRFFDIYVSQPMQKIVIDRIRPEHAKDPTGVAEARQTLDTAYAMIDAQLVTGPWAIGADFTIADCAAGPGLFFAGIVHPFGLRQTNLRRYFERLLDRPSVRRVFVEAQPWFHMFPYRDAMPEAFTQMRL